MLQAWLRSLKPRKISSKAWERMLDAAISLSRDKADAAALDETLQAWNAICSQLCHAYSSADQVRDDAHKAVPVSSALGDVFHFCSKQTTCAATSQMVDFLLFYFLS